jgi:Ser/Thr protein kinase RdoA (MazF antagonist)
MWVAYPWIGGRAYDGSKADIAAAGDLLGRMHVRTDYFDAALPRFKWPEHDEAAVKKEIEDLSRVLKSRAPEIALQVVGRAGPWHRTFMTDTLPAIRDSALPFIAGTTDFRASNLVYTATGPVLIDPDNADYLPRVLDLAIAALLFHNELPTAPPRLFTQAEWAVFDQAYSAQQTRRSTCGPTALQYIISEWGTWALVAADEWDGWADPRNRAFLTDLAMAGPDRFPLSAT